MFTGWEPLPDRLAGPRAPAPAFSFGDDIAPALYDLERVVAVRSGGDAEAAAAVARLTTEAAHGDRRCQLAASIVAAELATNVLKFGERGHVEVRIGPPYIELLSFDDGPDVTVPSPVHGGHGYGRAPWLLPGAATYAYGLGAVVRLMDHVRFYGRHPDRLRVLCRRRLVTPPRT